MSGLVVAPGTGFRDGSSFGLRTSCVPRVLRTYDESRPELMDGVARMRLRENAARNPVARDLGDRLPYWVLARKNRVRVLRGLDRLRSRAAQHRVLGRLPPGPPSRRS